jgi:hypothetical protein
MLSPVSVISAVGAASAEKPSPPAAETPSAGHGTAAPLVLLPNAADASVEGKLTMLLVAARDRMFESLLAAIDTASEALDVPRQPDESNAAFAGRLADAVRGLTPVQLTEVQRQMDAMPETAIPLPLLADVLTDPAGPAAAQLAEYLEPPQEQATDIVLKAIVNSYEQNAGEPEPSAPQAPAAANTAAAGNTAATVSPTPEESTPVSVTAPTPQPVAAGQAAPAAEASTAEPATPPASILAPQPGTIAAEAPPQAAMPEQSPAVAAAFVATDVPPAPTGPASETPPPTPIAAQSAAAAPNTAAPNTAVTPALLDAAAVVPRAIQEIRADIHEGLQAVLGRMIDIVGPELVQIAEQGEALADRVMAQAVAADAQDRDVLQPQQAARDPSSAPLAGGNNPQASAEPPHAADAAVPLQAKPLPPGNPQMPMNLVDVAAQVPLAALLPLAVPFVIVPYLPEDVAEEKGDPERVDRVDPTEDEEPGGQQGETFDEHDDAEPQSGDAEESAAEAEVPRPDAEADHAFDFYRRMVGWE